MAKINREYKDPTAQPLKRITFGHGICIDIGAGGVLIPGRDKARFTQVTLREPLGDNEISRAYDAHELRQISQIFAEAADAQEKL